MRDTTPLKSRYPIRDQAEPVVARYIESSWQRSYVRIDEHVSFVRAHTHVALLLVSGSYTWLQAEVQCEERGRLLRLARNHFISVIRREAVQPPP